MNSAETGRVAVLEQACRSHARTSRKYPFQNERRRGACVFKVHVYVAPGQRYQAVWTLDMNVERRETARFCSLRPLAHQAAFRAIRPRLP